MSDDLPLDLVQMFQWTLAQPSPSPSPSCEQLSPSPSPSCEQKEPKATDANTKAEGDSPASPPDLVRRALELGKTAKSYEYHELLRLIENPAASVRRAAASAIGKLLARSPTASGLVAIPLASAALREEHNQVAQYMLRALLMCAADIPVFLLDEFRDFARNPTRPHSHRRRASEILAVADRARSARIAAKAHWCTRCKKPITADESRVGLTKYGRPYCRHCLDERQLEDVNFERTMEGAKRLRTVDRVAVQSRGEKRIGDWLSSHGIPYQYDATYRLAGDVQIRPDFYLPELDVYIEYWGMDTPEYVSNMQKKRILYQRAGKRLISISWRNQADIERILAAKLGSRPSPSAPSAQRGLAESPSAPVDHSEAYARPSPSAPPAQRGLPESPSAPMDHSEAYEQ